MCKQRTSRPESHRHAIPYYYCCCCCFGVPCFCVVPHRSAAPTIDDGGCFFWVALLCLVFSKQQPAAPLESTPRTMRNNSRDECLRVFSVPPLPPLHHYSRASTIHFRGSSFLNKNKRRKKVIFFLLFYSAALGTTKTCCIGRMSLSLVFFGWMFCTSSDVVG